MTTTNQIEAREAEADALLSRINGTPDWDRFALVTAMITLRMAADKAHAAYPQYRGHWDGWKLGRVIRDVETKAGVAFRAGDLALYNPARPFFPDSPITTYSVRN